MLINPRIQPLFPGATCRLLLLVFLSLGTCYVCLGCVTLLPPAAACAHLLASQLSSVHNVECSYWSPTSESLLVPHRSICCTCISIPTEKTMFLLFRVSQAHATFLTNHTIILTHTHNTNPGYNNNTMYFCSCSCGSNQKVLPYGGVCDKPVLPLVGNAAWCYLSVVIPLLILFMSLPRVEWKHRCLLCISASLVKVSGEERENGWFLPLVFLRITKDLTHLVSPRWDPSECDSGLTVVSIMLQLWWNQAFGEVWNCTCILMLRTAMINTKLHLHSDLMSTTSLLVAQSR